MLYSQKPILLFVINSEKEVLTFHAGIFLFLSLFKFFLPLVFLSAKQNKTGNKKEYADKSKFSTFTKNPQNDVSSIRRGKVQFFPRHKPLTNAHHKTTN